MTSRDILWDFIQGFLRLRILLSDICVLKGINCILSRLNKDFYQNLIKCNIALAQFSIYAYPSKYKLFASTRFFCSGIFPGFLGIKKSRDQKIPGTKSPETKNPKILSPEISLDKKSYDFKNKKNLRGKTPHD